MGDLPEVRIAGNEVFIGGEKLPGPIASVSVRPGGGNDINRLAVEFFVGRTVCDET